MSDETNYLLLLHNIGISQKYLSYIFNDNDNYKYIYESLSYNLLQTYGVRKKQIEYILNQQKIISIKDINKYIKKRNTKIITIKSDNYPSELKQIPNPPYLLYVRGIVDSGPKFSIVGSRKITSYGEDVIDYIVTKLSNHFSIVSGGAAGCDTKAHKVCLKSGGRTISVIGTGINIDYPSQNKDLFDDIVINGGAVISIFPFEEVGNPYNFPIRNEIVAGLSIGTCIIEAKEKSGSLITGKLALELGRDLFAIPGEIFKSSSNGCNILIMNGEAKLVNEINDIFCEYNIGIDNKNINKENKKIKFTDSLEENIYKVLTLESFTIDQLTKNIDYDIQTISFKLSMMELGGIIKKIGGGKYQIIH